MGADLLSVENQEATAERKKGRKSSSAWTGGSKEAGVN